MTNEKEIQHKDQCSLSREEDIARYQALKDAEVLKAKNGINEFMNGEKRYVEYDELIRKSIKKMKESLVDLNNSFEIRTINQVIKLCDLEEETNSLMFGSMLSKKTVKSMLKDIEKFCKPIKSLSEDQARILYEFVTQFYKPFRSNNYGSRSYEYHFSRDVNMEVVDSGRQYIVENEVAYEHPPEFVFKIKSDDFEIVSGLCVFDQNSVTISDKCSKFEGFDSFVKWTNTQYELINKKSERIWYFYPLEDYKFS